MSIFIAFYFKKWNGSSYLLSFASLQRKLTSCNLLLNKLRLPLPSLPSYILGNKRARVRVAGDQRAAGTHGVMGAQPEHVGTHGLREGTSRLCLGPQRRRGAWARGAATVSLRGREAATPGTGSCVRVGGRGGRRFAQACGRPRRV